MKLLNSPGLGLRPVDRLSASGRALRSLRPQAALPDSVLKLDKPQRLWEAGSEFWFHGYQAPEYLTGELPGDAGFDPLGLADTSSIQAGSAGFTGVGDDPEKNLLWLLEGELYNGRVAMLAVVGILGQELLGLKPWWQLPAQANLAPLLPDGPLKYAAVVAVGHALYGFFEWQRIRSFKKNNTTLNFDPLGLRKDYTRQAEVHNGRLAMLAVLGFAFQAVITGKTPLQNLSEHLADPLQNNILTQNSEGWYVEGAFLVFSVAINLIGFAKSRKDARVRTFFSDFESA